MKDLKPCPFCGSDEIQVITTKRRGHPIEINGKRSWYVICYDCDSQTGNCWDDDAELFGVYASGKEWAIDCWNRRVDVNKTQIKTDKQA